MHGERQLRHGTPGAEATASAEEQERRGARLALTDVTAGYLAGEPVLDRFTLAVPPGSFVGILGPNGSGKTTLLKVASGLLTTWGGRVELDGRDLDSFGSHALARTVGLVSQGTDLAFALQVREVVQMGRYPHLKRWQGYGVADRDAFAEAVAATEVVHLLDRPFPTLSGGEQRRVLLARALAQEPRLLLLDEPTTFLDIHHQQKLLTLLGGLNRELGVTIVVVLHDINLAALFCQRVVMVDRGRCLLDGTPEEVITEASIAEVYGCSVMVGRHPTAGVPHIYGVGPDS